MGCRGRAVLVEVCNLFYNFGCECWDWVCVPNIWHQTDAGWWVLIKIINMYKYTQTSIHFALHLHPRASRKNARIARAQMVCHHIFPLVALFFLLPILIFVSIQSVKRNKMPTFWCFECIFYRAAVASVCRWSVQICFVAVARIAHALILIALREIMFLFKFN